MNILLIVLIRNCLFNSGILGDVSSFSNGIFETILGYLLVDLQRSTEIIIFRKYIEKTSNTQKKDTNKQHINWMARFEF